MKQEIWLQRVYNAKIWTGHQNENNPLRICIAQKFVFCHYFCLRVLVILSQIYHKFGEILDYESTSTSAHAQEPSLEYHSTVHTNLNECDSDLILKCTREELPDQIRVRTGQYWRSVDQTVQTRFVKYPSPRSWGLGTTVRVVWDHCKVAAHAGQQHAY